MKAIISTTLDDKYQFFLPIVSWCWNKLEIDVICFCRTIDEKHPDGLMARAALIGATLEEQKLRIEMPTFSCPIDKEATYAQISRMYASSLRNIPNEEVLISGDVDMVVMKNIFDGANEGFLFNLGYDLVPDNQLPMCYTWGEAGTWDFIFEIKGKSLQECLDQQLGHEEMINMRGCLWSRDQEIMAKAFSKYNYASTIRIPRAREGTTFANHRLDRDDQFILDRLSPDIIDFHMPRPGYEENNFNIILTVLKYFYPNDNFQWLIDYRQNYISLL